MKLPWISLVVLPLLTSVVLTTAQAQSVEPPLKFENFPVSQIYKGTPAIVNLNSNPEARRFRGVLGDGAKEGPNFAGHYTVVLWGCGTGCQSLAIVNAKTGAVYMTGLSAEVGAKFQIDSKLLVINPPENMTEGYGSNKPDWLTSRYYVWENNRLVQIYPPKSERSPVSQGLYKVRS
ncbi:MAG TPA: hypothetical protein V6C90_26870 [Coleofasciculaceae cyanobacterium]